MEVSEYRDTQGEGGKFHDATMTYTPAWLGASPGLGPHGYGIVQNGRKIEVIYGEVNTVT